MYVLNAEIYRDAGDIITASRWMEEAQSLDTADRFINAQCTKYMVQAQRQEDAETMAAKFTRVNPTTLTNLHYYREGQQRPLISQKCSACGS